MEPESYIQESLVFIILIILSAFFSGSETAFLSLSHSKTAHLGSLKKRVRARLDYLGERTQELLIAILIGNTLVNLSAATVAAVTTARLAHETGLNPTTALTVEIIVVTLILLFFSELMPKIVAVNNPVRFAAVVSGPLAVFLRLVHPLSWLLSHFTDFVSKLLGVHGQKYSLKQEELMTLVEVGEEEGALESDEREMIDSIFEFRDTQVKEIMIPRTDMVCIRSDATLAELVELIKTMGHTRIPIYVDKVDNIIGILHAKDLIPYLKQKKEISLQQLARPVIFVPEYKMINDLLREFQRKRVHMAIVVDEYGGTSGLITLEDILEEIVGEIQDEYDKETPLFRKIADSTWLVNAKIDLHDLNRELEIDLPTEDDYESLAGFLLSLTGTVPREKQVIRYENFDFTIDKVEKNRIVMVRIRLRDRKPGAESPAKTAHTDR